MTPNKLLSLLLSFSLIFEQAVFAQTIDLSHYFARNSASAVPQSDKFRPLHLRYISSDNQANDFKLLLDKGDFFNQKTEKPKNEKTLELEKTTQELMKYFFIGLALPNEKFWVNLRPDSPDNILDPDLEKTDIGKIFLEADLQLKKDTSGMTSPQTKEGKEYWDKLYKKAGELFGSENITIPTITRPWIVPDEVIIRESPEGAYIYKATLKVMLEEDYLNQKTEKPKNQKTEIYNFSDPRLKELNEYSTQLIKESIIPRLTKEINSARRYAQLRQVYYSLILAQWFKQKYGSAGSVRASGTRAPVNSYIDLIDSGNLANLAASQPYDKQAYFQQYQQSFKDGEYNLQEPVYAPMGQSIRRYMSGGIKGLASSSAVKILGKTKMPKSDYLAPFAYDGKFAKAISAIFKLTKDFNSKQKEIAKHIINTYKNWYPPLLDDVVSEESINDMRMITARGDFWLHVIPAIFVGVYAFATSFSAVVGGYELLRFYSGAAYSFYSFATAGAVSVLLTGGTTYAFLKYHIKNRMSSNSRTLGWHEPRSGKVFIFPERLSTTSNFVDTVAHELSHKFRLPNHILLANAYAGIIEWSMSTSMRVRNFLALDAINKFYGTFAQKEAILRRIVSDDGLWTRFSDAADKEEKNTLNSILNEASLTLDFNIPRPRGENGNEWVYKYGYLLGMLIYFECGHDVNKAKEILLELGMARDVREVDIKKIINSSVDSRSNASNSLSLKSDDGTMNPSASSAAENAEASSSLLDKKGGIDLSRINKSIRTESVTSPGADDGSSLVDVDFDLNEELPQLQKLLNAEIVPSADRLNRYARAACSSSLSSPDSKDSALSLVAETFRLQEEKSVSASAELKALAAWLEQAG